MNIDIYLNDGKVISSIGVNGATLEEALSAIKAFGFGENEKEWLYSDNQKIRYRVEYSDKISIKDLTCEVSALKDTLNDAQNENSKLYHKNREVMDERDVWKEKYKIECQLNDNLKQAFKNLENSSSNLLKRLDEQLEEYKQITSENDQLKAQYKSCLENNDILEDAVNEWKDKYAIECQHNDEIKKAYDELLKNFNDLVKERDEWRDKCNMFEKAYTSSSARYFEIFEERNKLKDERDVLIDEVKKYYKELEALKGPLDPQDGLCSL